MSAEEAAAFGNLDAIHVKDINFTIQEDSTTNPLSSVNKLNYILCIQTSDDSDRYREDREREEDLEGDILNSQDPPAEYWAYVTTFRSRKQPLFIQLK